VKEINPDEGWENIPWEIVEFPGRRRCRGSWKFPTPDH
jgi:hypothetical protein